MLRYTTDRQTWAYNMVCMTSGQETEQVNSYNPGARTGPLLQKGIIRGVFLTNHLASIDNLTRTPKRQNTHQHKLTIHKKWP